MKPNGGPAFPVSTSSSGGEEHGDYGHQDGHSTWQFPGMTLRDYFAVRAPAPTKEAVELIMRMEQQANQHNDHYKPARRGILEIECALRYKWADAMIEARTDQASAMGSLKK